VHLLHHLATGRPPADEHDTTLLKVLGGLPIAYPLPRDLPVSLEERHEAETLLTAAIRHWDKLRNTSPAGLREAFLQREGKLVTRPEGPRLIVEQRPVDVLLGDPTKAKKKLKWTPKVTFEKLVEEMVDYEIKHAKP
jgi:GDP-D-mannose dehydratase